jgi:hypothetical protein
LTALLEASGPGSSPNRSGEDPDSARLNLAAPVSRPRRNP